MKNNMKIFTIAAVCFILLAIPLVLSSGFIDIPELSGEDVASVQSSMEMPSVFVDPQQIVGNHRWDLGFNISDTFQVHVKISDATDLYTWNVNVAWNPAMLNFTRITSYGDLLNQTVSPYGTSRIVDMVAVSNETGFAVVAETILGDYPGINGSGRLITIEFLIIGYGTSNLTISLNGTLPTKLLDSTGQTLTFTAVDGYFTNVAPVGDVNDDGLVDILDLTLVGWSYGSFMGEPHYNLDADINNDEIVDIADISIVTMNYGRAAL